MDRADRELPHLAGRARVPAVERRLLRNARVIDGTGAPAFAGHVLLEGDRIGAVFREGEALPEAAAEIDVAGRAVTPGFIDMHSHVDFLLPVEEQADIMRCMLEQGVTTVVAGNCGISPAPIQPGRRERVAAAAALMIERPLDWGWRSMGEYLGRVESARPAVNVAQLVGHGTLRHAGADTVRGRLGEADLGRCLDEARRALAEGACGLSFGLGYDPGMYSPLEELREFSRVAAAAGKPVTVHLKAYSRLSPCYPLADLRAHNLRALREMLGVAAAAGARLQVSHLIFVGRSTWASAPRALEMIDRARRDGQDVAFDAFPYTCGNTTIHAPLPYWFLALGPAAYRSRLARARLRLEVEIGFRLVGFRYDDFQVMEIAVPEWQELNGLTVAEIAARWRISPFDAMLRIAERSVGAALMLFHSYSGDRDGRGPIDDVIAHPACLYETDAIIRSKGWPNPAAVGTFPKILGDHVRRRRRLGLEEAVRRMTSASAARFGLRDRGVLAAGCAADLVVFDPERVDDTPPRAGAAAGRPVGIAHVFVNGEPVVDDGGYRAGARSGRVLT
jgi:N-acyl-D-amino-acid deacylase